MFVIKIICILWEKKKKRKKSGFIRLYKILYIQIQVIQKYPKKYVAEQKFILFNP